MRIVRLSTFLIINIFLGSSSFVMGMEQERKEQEVHGYDEEVDTADLRFLYKDEIKNEPTEKKPINAWKLIKTIVKEAQYGSGSMSAILGLKENPSKEEIQERASFLRNVFKNVNEDILDHPERKKSLAKAINYVNLSEEQFINLRFPSWSYKIRSSDVHQQFVATTKQLVTEDTQKAVGYLWVRWIRKHISSIPGVKTLGQWRENILDPQKSEVKKREKKIKKISKQGEKYEMLNYALAMANKKEDHE